MNEKGNTTLLLIGGVVVLAAVAAVVAFLCMDTKGKGGSGLSKEFSYDLEDLKKTDPTLILYHETDRPIHTGLSLPTSIAVGPEEVIYVGGEQEVRTYSPAGGQGKFEVSLDGEPRCLAVARDGTVYVGMKNHVEVYSPEGRIVKRWESAGPDALLTSIAVAEDTIYVADFSRKEVLRYDPSGSPRDSMGEFVIPSPYFDVALGSNGMVHVTNTGEHRIEAYTPEGNLQSFWGTFSNTNAEGFSGCCNPVNIALLPEGKGFVTTEKGLSRVKIYDGEGTFKGFVAGPESFTRHDSLCNAPDYDLTRVGLDVAVDGKGRVLVLDPATAQVRIFVSRDG